MRQSKIDELIGWTSRVLMPITKPMKPYSHPFKIVAFDMEDYKKRTVVLRRPGRVDIETEERGLLCVTFAAEIDGQIKTERMDIEHDISWDKLIRFIRKWTRWNDHIFLLTHYAAAELRHIKDWREKLREYNVINPKAAEAKIYGGDKIHIFTPDVTIIDTFAYFQTGLDQVARMVGMKKLKFGLDGRPWKSDDDNCWIKHMDEFKLLHPKEFWEYAEEDPKILLKGFANFRDWLLNLRDGLTELTVDPLQTRIVPTTPSIAIHILRRMMNCAEMPYEQSEFHRERRRAGGQYGWNSEKNITLQPEMLVVRQFAQRAAWGGRREPFGAGLLDSPVVALDFSGHYNRCGIDQPLNCEHTAWFQTTNPETIMECEGFVRLKNWRFDVSTKYPMIVNEEIGKRLVCVQGDGCAYTTAFEFKIAVAFFGLKFEQVTGCVFHPTDHERNSSVRRFSLFFRKLKDIAEEDAKAAGVSVEDDANYRRSKLIPNAVYGKFRQATQEDEDTVLEFLGYFPKGTVRNMRRNRPMDHHKMTAKFFAPEWSALILGRARGLLALAFSLPDAITGHTDSAIIKNDPEIVASTIEVLEIFGGTLDRKWVADGLICLRSSLYAALRKNAGGKWELAGDLKKDGRTEYHEAHHGLSVDDRRMFWNAVIAVINGGEWIPPILKKSHLSHAKTEVDRGVPLGMEYKTFMRPVLKWDYKRKLPPDFRYPDDCFRRFVWTTPYESERAAYKAEQLVVEKTRGIGKGRPRKEEITERQDLTIRDLRARGKSLRYIAKAVGLSEAGVRWRLKQKGTTQQTPKVA